MTITAQFVAYIEVLATFALLLYASYEDIQRRQVDDWVIISILVVWFCSSLSNILFRNITFLDMLFEFAWGLFVLFVLLGLTHFFEKGANRELVGGGDLKLLAALSLQLDLDHFLLMMLISCLSGVIIAFILSRVNFEEETGQKFMAMELPWIPSISIGFIVAEILMLF